MSLFSKPLMSFGVGAATVDTRLEKSTFRQGEPIRGEVYIQGGDAEQKIDEINLYLMIQYDYEGSRVEYVVDEYRLTDPFTIGVRETKIVPFDFPLPLDVPITASGCLIYIKTGLNIKKAVNPKDKDGIELLPHPYVDEILYAIEGMGFRLERVLFDFEHFYSRHPFVQVYRFQPGDQYQNTIDHCGLVFQAHVKEVNCILQIDRKPVDLISSMAEALSLDVLLHRFSLSVEEIERGNQLIQKKVRNCIEEGLNR